MEVNCMTHGLKNGVFKVGIGRELLNILVCIQRRTLREGATKENRIGTGAVCSRSIFHSADTLIFIMLYYS